MLVGEVHQGHICTACLEKNVLRYVNEDHCPVCRGCDYSLEEDICYNLKCPRGKSMELNDLLIVDINDIKGTVKKADDRYTVRDNAVLSNLVLSSTHLNPHCSTTGHAHTGQEEVYIFIEGAGNMIVAPHEEPLASHNIMKVKAGDIILIPNGFFHRVINGGEDPLYFLTVFAGHRAH